MDTYKSNFSFMLAIQVIESKIDTLKRKTIQRFGNS